MRLSRWLFLFVAIFVFVSAPVCAQENDNALPDTFTFGAGWQEVFKNYPYKNGADFRLEHRWGISLLSAASDFFAPLDAGFQIHPFVGIETATRVQMYGFGGLILDFLLGRNVVISPNFTIGYYGQGQGKRLGYPVEFRSTFEAGYRFDSNWRLTGYVSHVSNAGLGRRNPGVEMCGLYIHIPLTE